MPGPQHLMHGCEIHDLNLEHILSYSIYTYTIYVCILDVFADLSTVYIQTEKDRVGIWYHNVALVILDAPAIGP